MLTHSLTLSSSPGGTDSSAYAAINHQRGTLRFVPRRATVQDAHRAHGTNERLAVTDFKGALCTYRRGLQLFGRLGELEGRGSAGPAAGGAHKGVAAGRAGAFGGRRATPGLGRAGVSLAPRVVGQGVAAE
ncbi:hypothetical protein MNEG_12264 [Monoraphidium neglectum]|uniref:Uncharacterized protein n=1 Tax=Monoraphidium neglectum TaxID=145388 RepID=A0A0D2KIU4_9CHLO|nr:hypothetical protein MNEG_12264 [Monoraphidium neglectum]KIY95698.1 hypothetical protein MNEG_12264 [Monoraphidium neglectum]|eukprot:XP_013894718.1 hypothetical protein MNEG_12264 [Monoraphidium neglectum]